MLTTDILPPNIAKKHKLFHVENKFTNNKGSLIMFNNTCI